MIPTRSSITSKIAIMTLPFVGLSMPTATPSGNANRNTAGGGYRRGGGSGRNWVAAIMWRCFMSKPVQSFMRMLKWGRKMCFYFYFGIFSAIFCWLVFARLNIYAIHNTIEIGLGGIAIATISIIL